LLNEAIASGQKIEKKKTIVTEEMIDAVFEEIKKKQTFEDEK